jgi:hypothetical protein
VVLLARGDDVHRQADDDRAADDGQDRLGS